MILNIRDNDMLEFTDAIIAFKDFDAVDSNPSFTIAILDPEMADALVARGYNVKITPKNDDSGENWMNFKVYFKFREFEDRNGGYPYITPEIVLMDGDAPILITPANVKILQDISIQSVDFDAVPHDWTKAGRSGRSCYMRRMRVYAKTNRFSDDISRARARSYQ